MVEPLCGLVLRCVVLCGVAMPRRTYVRASLSGRFGAPCFWHSLFGVCFLRNTLGAFSYRRSQTGANNQKGQLVVVRDPPTTATYVRNGHEVQVPSALGIQGFPTSARARRQHPDVFPEPCFLKTCEGGALQTLASAGVSGRKGRFYKRF